MVCVLQSNVEQTAQANCCVMLLFGDVLTNFMGFALFQTHQDVPNTPRFFTNTPRCGSGHSVRRKLLVALHQGKVLCQVACQGKVLSSQEQEIARDVTM